MNLTFRECTIQDLNELIEISRNTFIDAFEKDNNPIDFKSYMNKAFGVKL